MQQFGGKPKKSSPDTKRHFTVVIEKGGKGGALVPPNEHGLYVSSTPSSAARKAVTKLCAANKSKKVEFHIREITQGSKKKIYGPYVGYIKKLKEPIELKGRVIKYKPVAKLSGKTSKKTLGKKGGMIGGGPKEPPQPQVSPYNFVNSNESNRSFAPSFGIFGSPEQSAPRLENINGNRKQLSLIVDYKNPMPKFVIETKEDLRRKNFDPLILVCDRNKFRNGNTNHFLFDWTKTMPGASPDRKKISFILRKDITEEKIYKFLRDEEKKSKIIKNFVDLGIAHEATIFLDIPYIFEGEAVPRFERIEYLKYIPPAHLASQAINNSSEPVDYEMMENMRHGFNRTIRTKSDISEYFRIKQITNKKRQDTIIKHYEAFRGKPLI